MLKKNEVLEILENGGYILMNTIYRTADVYNASGLHEDNCRYDTADRIGRADGYTRENGGWSYTDRIEKTAQEVEDDAEPFGLAACIRSIEFDRDTLHMDDAAIMVELLRAQEINGAFFNSTMWDAFEAVFPDFPVSLEVCHEIYNNTLADDGETTDRARAARNIRNYAEAIRAEREQEQQPETIEQEPEQEPDHIYIDENAPESNSIPETRQEKTDRENRKHCKHIADELDAYVNGLVYECPECGEHIQIADLDALTTETEDGETLYRLPCGCTVDEEPEQRDMYDFLADVFDIEYRIEHSDRETVRSVRVLVAFGGPNIYIDSASRAVELYWWTDRASYPISSDAADALDEWAQELWSCC